MRSFVVAVFALFSLSICAAAQNSAQMAAQQASQAAMQANQQAMQAAQQANQQAMEANQQAMQAAQQANEQAAQAAQAACCIAPIAASPRFSLKTGSYSPGTTVRLKDRTRGAVMYYTTDGWAPTTQSRRYVGPIMLHSTTTLRAIAVAPGCMQSGVATAVYTIPGAPPAALSTSVADLSPGTPLPLIFTSAVTSKGLQIGDQLPVALAQDLVVGGVLVAPKLTPALTTVMQVDGTGAAGAPGSITFAVHSITLTNGETIPLSGAETTNGRSHSTASESLSLVPWVGLAALFIHGKQAKIPKGATFTAYVQAKDPAVIANGTQPQPVQPQ